MHVPSELAEAWTFGTSVRSGRVGEYRDALGLRETHQLAWAVEPPERLRMELSLRRGFAAGGEFYVPVWSAASWMADPVVGGQDELEVDGPGEYRVGDLVALVSSDLDYELQFLTGISGSTLQFAASPGLGARAGRFLVAPVATCLLPDGIQFAIDFAVQRPRGEFVRLDPGVEGVNPFASFEGVPILPRAPVLSGTLVAGVGQTSELQESGLGAVGIAAVELYSRGRGTMAFASVDEARWEVRGWLRYLRGRDRSFWMPSFVGELPVLQSIGAVSFDTLNFAGSADLSGAVIYIVDGDLVVTRRVSGTTVVSGRRRLSYPSIGQALTTGARVSIVRRMRLDTDEVRFEHEFIGGGLLSRVSLPLREVVE